MKNLKKAISTTLAITLLSTASLMPMKAQALISLASWTSPRVIFFGAFSGVSVGDDAGAAVLGLLVFVGIVILDQNGQQVPAFAPVSLEQKALIGLSDDEFNAYNDSIPEINSVVQSVAQDLSIKTAPTVQDSRAAWSNYEDQLPDGAMNAIQKIVNFASGKAK